jgi:hypothetical protein
MVTHMVLFNFERATDAEEAQKRLLEMRGKVPGLLEIEAGVDFTRGERSFELGLITRHPDRAALDAYRVHPVHLEVARFIQERSRGAAAVDFESGQ